MSLLRPAFERFDQSKGMHTRFTFLDLNHTVNINNHGKKTADETHLYDVTYIGDLQYSRLLEVDGKSLSGKDLKKEQERYDDAVRQRSALDDAARAKILHEAIKNFGMSLSISELSSKYQNTFNGQAAVEDCDCVIIESTPLLSATTRRYRFWIDPKKQEVMRIETTLLADEGETLKGGAMSLQFTYIDGVPLVSHSHFDVTLLKGKHHVQVITDHVYSRFRKFSVTTTLVPVEPAEKRENEKND